VRTLRPQFSDRTFVFLIDLLSSCWRHGRPLVQTVSLSLEDAYQLVLFEVALGALHLEFL